MPTILEAYQNGLERLRTAAAAAVGTAWDQLPAYDIAQIDEFVNRSVPVVGAAQTQAAALTDAFLATQLGGPPVGVAADRVTGPAVRNGAEPADVYRRPFVTTWSALSESVPYVDAVAQGRARAVTSARTDVQLAMRQTAHDVLGRDQRVRGYRRVLTGESCAFCATASTQRYRRGDLLPMHPNCDCTVAPIVGDRDPGSIVNRRLLDGLKAAGGPQYWRDRGISVVDDQIVKNGQPFQPAVREHGELGPMLVDPSQHFTQL